MFKVLMSLTVGFMMFLPSASARPMFNLEDRGVYLIRGRTQLKFSAAILLKMDPGISREGYKVVIKTPWGADIDVPFKRAIEQEEDYYFYSLPSIPVDELAQGRSLAGEYVFLLVDKQGNTVASAEDILIPYSEIAKEEMSFFDDADILPKDQAVVEGKKITLSWSAIKGANRYLVDIYKGAKCSGNRVVRLWSSENRVDFSADGLFSGAYCWQLEAIHEEGGGKVKNAVIYRLPNGQFPVFNLK